MPEVTSRMRLLRVRAMGYFEGQNKEQKKDTLHNERASEWIEDNSLGHETQSSQDPYFIAAGGSFIC